MAEQYKRPRGSNRFQVLSAQNSKLPSSELDQEFNLLYGVANALLTASAQNLDCWSIFNGTFTYVDDNEITVDGDFSDYFYILRPLRSYDSVNGYNYSFVKSVAYNSGLDVTVVTTFSNIFFAATEDVSVGFLDAEALNLTSTAGEIITSNKTVGYSDKIILADDTNATSQMWTDDDDGETASTASILVTLPPASDYEGRILTVKKTAGTNQVIVSAPFEMTTSLDGEGNTIHTYTYDFQISGANRVTLSGIGDICVLFTYNGNWYNMIPYASQTATGIIRTATDDEMTLTDEQIEAGDELRKDLAVSPYEVDKEYLRVGGSNAKFASNFIYKAPNGVASLVNNQIIVPIELGGAIPNGFDSEGAIQNTLYELDAQITISNAEVTETTKVLFIVDDGSWVECLLDNYHMSYTRPEALSSGTVVWWDLSTNLLKKSTDGGNNFVTLSAFGPICQYSGDGEVITTFTSFAPISILKASDLSEIYKKSLQNSLPDYTAGVSKTKDTEYTAECAGELFIFSSSSDYCSSELVLNGTTYPLTTFDDSGPSECQLAIRLNKGDTYEYEQTFSTAAYTMKFFPLRGALL